MSLALQGRGLFSGVLGGLGVSRCRALGGTGSAGGLHSPFSLSSSSVFYADSPAELLPLLHQGVSFCCCSEGFNIQGCHRAGFSWSRFLQSPFCHTEGHWLLAAGYRSVLPQSFYSAVSLPHGDGPVVLQSIRSGDWMISLDLQDAYLQVPVHPQSRTICVSVCAIRFINFGFYALVCHPHLKSSLVSWPRSPLSCIVLGSGSFVI